MKLADELRHITRKTELENKKSASNAEQLADIETEQKALDEMDDYIQNLPAELQEAAKKGGKNEYRAFSMKGKNIHAMMKLRRWLDSEGLGSEERSEEIDQGGFESFESGKQNVFWITWH